MNIEKITEKREGLITNYNSLVDKKVELEKQLDSRKEQVLRLEGAIEALNMTLKKPEEDGTEEVK